MKYCENCYYSSMQNDLGSKAPRGQVWCKLEGIFVNSKSSCNKWLKK